MSNDPTQLQQATTYKVFFYEIIRSKSTQQNFLFQFYPSVPHVITTSPFFFLSPTNLSTMASLLSLSLSLSLFLLFLTLLSQTHLTFSLTITKKPFNHSRTSHPLQSITDIHDLLPLYGLPKGLIPSDIQSYTLDKASGLFSIEMTRTCYVHFQQLVWYDKHIKGKLSYGAVHDVSGIQAKELFLWLPVTGIEKVKNSDMLRFFVGALSEDLPAEQFQEIPQCKSKVSQRPSISSIWGKFYSFYLYIIIFIFRRKFWLCLVLIERNLVSL